MTLDLQATPEQVMRAVETLEEFARSQGVPETVVFGLALSLEECASNIVNHAFQRDSGRRFQVTFSLTKAEFTIELRDAGPEFDPTSTAERPLRAKDDDLPGGWGIQLVRHHVDEVRYRRENGENVLRLVKRVV